MNIFSNAADKLAKVQARLIEAQDARALAQQALDTALQGELDGTADAKATAAAHKAVAATSDAVAHLNELVAMAQARHAAEQAALAETERIKADAESRKEIAQECKIMAEVSFNLSVAVRDATAAHRELAHRADGLRARHPAMADLYESHLSYGAIQRAIDFETRRLNADRLSDSTVVDKVPLAEALSEVISALPRQIAHA